MEAWLEKGRATYAPSEAPQHSPTMNRAALVAPSSLTAHPGDGAIVFSEGPTKHMVPVGAGDEIEIGHGGRIE